MSTLNPTITIDGSGDFGRDRPDYAGRLRRARLGLAVAVTPIVMLFVSFTSAYVVRQGLPTYDDRTGTYVRDWFAVTLPLTILLVNTLVLVASSITMELARRQAARGTSLAGIRSVAGVYTGDDRLSPWLTATVVLGMAFLAGQFFAWRELAYRGFYLATNPSSSFVYLLTATHAVHLAGGLLVLLYAFLAALAFKPTESRYIVLDVAAWYWHFMAVLWLYLFALLQFAR